MAQCDPESTLPDFFFKPLAECYSLSDAQHLCHELSDLDYLKLGVDGYRCQCVRNAARRVMVCL